MADGLEDIEESIDLARSLVRTTSPGRPVLPAHQLLLGATLTARFERSGAPGDIDEAITVLGEAVRATSPSDLLHSDARSHLGVALWARFKHTGVLADIEQAITHLTMAVQLTDENSPVYPQYLANLGTATLTWAERVAFPRKLIQQGGVHGHVPQELVLKGLDGAIGALREAFRRAPDHYGQALCLSNLGLALQIRHDMTEALEDIDEAVGVLRAAVAATPPDDRSLPERMTNLCMVLQRRFLSIGDPGKLVEAIEVGKDAVAALPPDSPARARALANVGECLESGYELDHGDYARQEAMRYFREAACSEAAPIWDRIRPARGWGHLAAAGQDWAEATTAYACAIEMLPSLAWHGMSEIERLGYLGAPGLSGIASEAAACALSSGQPQTAAELLEQGRGLLIAQTLELRADLSELRAQHRDTARELEAIDDMLGRSSAAAMSLTESGQEGHDSRQQLAHRRHEIVTQVQGMAGFEDFERPLEYARLQNIAAETEGAIVSVNVAQSRCDALILAPSGLTVIPLPGLTRERAAANAAAFLRAIDDLDKAEQARDLPRQAECRQDLAGILTWLWDVIASPVLDTLRLNGSIGRTPGLPHIWWIPTGPLSFLPLHAAGTGGDSVTDYAVSSYAPTVRALAYAQRRAPGKPAVLVVAPENDLHGAEHPAGTRQQDGFEKEVTDLLSFSPDLLIGKNATRDNVVKALGDAGIVHFACHGYQNLSNPVAGHLKLHNGTLGVLELGRINLTEANLVFLSACQTAVGGHQVEDESIHLAAAFSLAGFPHVIGTLWPINSYIAAQIAAAFYAGITAPNGRITAGRAAHALHAAIQETRMSHPDKPDLWASHIHLGPMGG